jgi:DHA2 family multidrug resistance protein
MILRGIGFGMSGIPLQTVALEKLKGYELPRASSLYNASAQIFSSIGIAVLTTIFVQQTTAHQPSQAAIQALAQSTAQQMAPAYLAEHPGLTQAALQTTPDFTQQVQASVTAQVTSQAGIPAMIDVFWVVSIAMVALVFLSFILPDKRSRQSVGAEEKAESERNEPMLVE